ncbi:MAG: transglutaminase domain-containing protein [Ruminiclostridium sp.]
MKKQIIKALTVIIVTAVVISITSCSANSTNSVNSGNGETTAPVLTSTILPLPQTTEPPSTAFDTEVTVPETTVTTKATVSATTVADTETTPATTAEPVWKETEKSAEMYLNTSVYSRTKAYLGAPTADLYQINDKVKVVAVTDTDYYKLSDGKFIHCDYLSDKKTVIQTTTVTTTTAPQTTPAPSTTTKKNSTKPSASGKYISSGYEPLDDIIFPLLDNLVNDKMSDDDKRLVIYDYLVSFQYQERTLLIPESKKQYEEQLEAISLFEKGYGLCYDFSAAFKYMTKAIGMNTVMYYGSHKSRNSGYTPHSWTMLEIDGMLYFFDPSMERVMINDGLGDGQHYRYKKPYYWFYDYYITDYTTE